MTNAIDELRRRAALGTPEAAAASEAEGRAQNRVKNGAAPWIHYTKLTGTLKAIEQGRVMEFGTFGNFIFTGVTDVEENPKYNADRDTLADGVIEVKFPDPGKGISRQWEPTVLMVESARALDPAVADVFSLVGRNLTIELTVEFITNHDGSPYLDKKGYQSETWYYKVTNLAAAKGEAKADPANVAALAATLYGTMTPAAAPALLKAMTDAGIKDAALQKLVVSNGFAAYAEAEGLLASAEGVFYDPTANSA